MSAPLYTLARFTAGTVLRWGWRPRVDGLRHVPEGGAILAGNHLAVADELFLAAVVPRHIAFWAEAEYFSGGPLTRTLVGGLGAIRVERDGGRAGRGGRPDRPTRRHPRAHRRGHGPHPGADRPGVRPRYAPR